MARFSYQAFDTSGQIEQGTIEAGTEQLAYETLRGRGLTVFEVSAGEVAPTPVPLLRRPVHLTGPRIDGAEEAQVARLLAVLFRTGLPIDPPTERVTR